MRIGHFQFEARCGEFEKNLARVVEGLQRADRERVEIVSFPECCLTGYPDVAETARRDAFAVDATQMMQVLDRTAAFEATVIVGFNELRGADLYNTAAVVHKGHLLGTYSKCSAYMSFHKQGRTFPIFERSGVKFGVIICSDGGYIEPARILAFQGAQIIFAPHYNYIGKDYLLKHFHDVRADHTARASENRVFFVRGNNVGLGPETGIVKSDGIAYGDSYILDPRGEIVVRSRRHKEDFIFADVDPKETGDMTFGGQSRSLWSWRQFAKLLAEAAGT